MPEENESTASMQLYAYLAPSDNIASPIWDTESGHITAVQCSADLFFLMCCRTHHEYVEQATQRVWMEVVRRAEGFRRRRCVGARKTCCIQRARDSEYVPYTSSNVRRHSEGVP